jgi:hypothetical protein
VKARYILWPVVVFGALSVAGACSSDSGTTSGTGATGGAADGGNGATTTGATSSMGNENAGGMSSTNGGAPVGGESTAAGGVPAEAGAATGGAGGAPDLCAGKNLDCPNDNNPCTEDACDPATGECGIPRTGTDCDDNIYCNGTDLCDAGECTDHSGNPCATHTCDEPGKSCQCATKDDCSPDQPGDWSDCVYTSECATAGSQSRPVTTYTCNVGTGKCVGKPTIEMMACTRVTQDQPCTSDSLRCDGEETCKSEKCTSSKVNPCVGNAAGTYCSENATYTCGVCSGNKAGGGYPGCSGTQSCCLVSGAWACQANTCKITLPALAIKPTLATVAIKGMPGAAPLE